MASAKESIKKDAAAAASTQSASSSSSSGGVSKNASSMKSTSASGSSGGVSKNSSAAKTTNGGKLSSAKESVQKTSSVSPSTHSTSSATRSSGRISDTEISKPRGKLTVTDVYAPIDRNYGPRLTSSWKYAEDPEMVNQLKNAANANYDTITNTNTIKRGTTTYDKYGMGTTVWEDGEVTNSGYNRDFDQVNKDNSNMLLNANSVKHGYRYGGTK